MRFRRANSVAIPGYGRPGRTGEDLPVPPLLARRLEAEGIAKRIAEPAGAGR
jgi:hypothetical protein